MPSINTGKPIVLNGESKYGRDIQALGRDVTGLKPNKKRRRTPVGAVARQTVRPRPS